MSGQACNGYITNGTEVLFNLGNYFKVHSFNSETKTLKISLVHLAENIDINLNNQEHCFALNRNWLNAQREKYEGQYHSLLIYDEKAATNYITSKIVAIQKDKQQAKEEAIFKWNLTKEESKIKMNKPIL
jgi:hypothetical protein